MGKLKKYISDKNKLLAVSGILHSSRAFLGPEVLHIDLTNVCNFNCIACWCRSPLLKDKAMPDWESKLTLPSDCIKNIFDDLAKIGGLRQVKLVGGGEPFMHPDILKIIENIKSKDRDIQIDINTNFSLVSEEVAKKLMDLEVDSLTVSLWAGTPEYYLAVHPGQTKETFFRIRDVLKYISSQKKQLETKRPKIIIHNVIMNLNYKDITGMLEFALDVGADGIQFVPIDPVKDRTEVLLASEQERKQLLELLYKIKKNYDSSSFKYTSLDGRSIVLADFDGFITRIEKLDLKSGAYDEERVEKIPCYVGWLFARVMATGNVVPCCKGHRMVMGNVHEDSFRKIWNSKKYREFRYKAKNFDKSNEYFDSLGNDASKKTGCYNCDNLWQNEPMHKLIKSLPIKSRRWFFFK